MARPGRVRTRFLASSAVSNTIAQNNQKIPASRENSFPKTVSDAKSKCQIFSGAAVDVPPLPPVTDSHWSKMYSPRNTSPSVTMTR
jgi:hypothetical protein